jgi:hypothetical protein
VERAPSRHTKVGDWCTVVALYDSALALKTLDILFDFGLSSVMKERTVELASTWRIEFLARFSPPRLALATHSASTAFFKPRLCLDAQCPIVIDPPVAR